MERSALYRESVAERAELLKHKWLESEKAGHDIGFEAALVSWVVHHRAQWRRCGAGAARADGALDLTVGALARSPSTKHLIK